MLALGGIEAFAQINTFDVQEPKTQYVCEGEDLNAEFKVTAPAKPEVSVKHPEAIFNSLEVLFQKKVGDVYHYLVKGAFAKGAKQASYIQITAKLPDGQFNDIEKVERRFAVWYGDGRLPVENFGPFGVLKSSEYKLMAKNDGTRFNNAENFKAPRPVFVDIDNDGYLDIFAGSDGSGRSQSQSGKVYFMKGQADGTFSEKIDCGVSYGTDNYDFGLRLPIPSDENASEKQPFYYPALTFGDLDGDGDLDVLMGYTRIGRVDKTKEFDNGRVLYFENVTPERANGHAEKIRFERRDEKLKAMNLRIDFEGESN
ncbi:MAG: FG-GAP-like repeat-containing protein, partial [Cytophagales bacterium]|nr:FG-GAP-like repeat-containing protein [Cytophagales bacterium]